MLFVMIKFVHFAAILFLFSASLYKNIRLSIKPVTKAHVYHSLTADKLSGMAAVLIILTGLMMIFGPASHKLYLLDRPAFWFKMVLLLLVSMLIIVTKIFLRKNAAKDSMVLVNVPANIILILRVDIFSLFVLVFFALCMVNLF
jgi:uncharacterized membrane protein